VGTKRPNGLGLHDMHGNVWEWCEDFHGTYSAESSVDPSGPKTGVGRVLRGGSWNYLAGYCRSSFRDRDPPDLRYFNVGFRVARTL